MGICSEAFYKHWIIFQFKRVTFIAIVAGVYPGKAKCGKNAIKRSFTLRLATDISLYLRNGWSDRYIQQSFWPASNPLSINVTLTAIVPGAYPGEAKMCKKCENGKLWTYGLNYWETVEDRWVYMLRCVWQALKTLSIHVTFTAIFPGAYPVEAKMCLRLIAETDESFLSLHVTSGVEMKNNFLTWRSLSLWFRGDCAENGPSAW